MGVGIVGAARRVVRGQHPGQRRLERLVAIAGQHREAGHFGRIVPGQAEAIKRRKSVLLGLESRDKHMPLRSTETSSNLQVACVMAGTTIALVCGAIWIAPLTTLTQVARPLVGS